MTKTSVLPAALRGGSTFGLKLNWRDGALVELFAFFRGLELFAIKVGARCARPAARSAALPRNGRP